MKNTNRKEENARKRTSTLKPYVQRAPRVILSLLCGLMIFLLAPRADADRATIDIGGVRNGQAELRKDIVANYLDDILKAGKVDLDALFPKGIRVVMINGQPYFFDNHHRMAAVQIALERGVTGPISMNMVVFSEDAARRLGVNTTRIASSPALATMVDDFTPSTAARPPTRPFSQTAIDLVENTPIGMTHAPPSGAVHPGVVIPSTILLGIAGGVIGSTIGHHVAPEGYEALGEYTGGVVGATTTAITVDVLIFGIPVGTAVVTNVGIASVGVVAEMTVLASAFASLGLAGVLGAEEHERLAQEWQAAFANQPMTDLSHLDRLYEVIWPRIRELQELVDNSNVYLAAEEEELSRLYEEEAYLTNGYFDE